ncbi:MAG: UbiA family prenyltransferase [Candidatus Omnitrophica bacterium]|nr:UbiA family prenyltransferase [Candidatus Omnitrophota bacterium]
MIKRLKDLLGRIESAQTPLSYAIVTFLSAVMLRTFWEHTLLMRDPFSNDWGIDHAHYLFFYIALALTLALLLYVLTGENIARIMRVVLPSFIVLTIVPLIDRVSGASAFFNVTYYFPEKHPDIWEHFFFFFGRLESTGATPGMRVEIALILLVIALYIFIKTQRPWHAVCGTLMAYVIIFAYIAMPVLVQGVAGLFKAKAQIDIAFNVRFYLMLIFPLGLGVLYAAGPHIFRAVFRDLRWMRLTQYLLLIVLGAVVCAKHFSGQVVFGQEGFFRVIFLLISVTLAWAFCVISNNWADEDIDRVANPRRPSVAGTVPAGVYRCIGWGCLWGAGIYALAINAATLEIMAVFTGAYSLYSMPPLRLKRVPVLSKFVIGLNALLMFMLGYMFWANSTTIQLPFILFFLLFFTFSANFIDIKDHDGDLAAGIKTLPVLLGPLWAKRLIGLSFVVTYLAAYETFMLQGFFWGCLATGAVQCILINRKNYDERPVLIIHVASLIFIIGYVLRTTGMGL